MSMIVCSKKSITPQQSTWSNLQIVWLFALCNNLKCTFKRKYPIAMKTHCMRARSFVDIPVQHREILLLIHHLKKRHSKRAGWSGFGPATFSQTQHTCACTLNKHEAVCTRTSCLGKIRIRILLANYHSWEVISEQIFCRGGMPSICSYYVH